MPEIQSRSATLLTLSPQLNDFASAWAREDSIEFEVLTDLGNAVARTYGLSFRLPDELVEVYRDHLKIDLARFNGDTTWELPLPAVYVIDPTGVVVHVAADPDYTRRPEPRDLLDILDGV